MVTIPMAIMIGVISSIFGALIAAAVLSLGQRGLQVRKDARNRASTARRELARQWGDGDPNIRQSITTSYLFDILRYLILGNIVLAAAAFLTFIDAFGGLGFLIHRAFVTFCGGLAFLFFYFSLGRVISYFKLTR